MNYTCLLTTEVTLTTRCSLLSLRAPKTSLNWMDQGASRPDQDISKRGGWHKWINNRVNNASQWKLTPQFSSINIAFRQEKSVCCLNDWGWLGHKVKYNSPVLFMRLSEKISETARTSSSRSFLKHRHAARFLKPSPSYVLVWFGLSFILGVFCLLRVKAAK